MAFFETPRFPENISEGSSGGPKWMTEVVVSDSGKETRFQRWENARHEYNVAYGIKDIEHLESLKTFFMTMRGRVHSFRYKDWEDYRSGPVLAQPSEVDQLLGTGDGIKTEFQLIKKYSVGGEPYSRDIKKPVVGTVVVSVDGVSTPATVDYTTGIATISPAPGAGLEVRAGFEFDVPCRFAQDALSTSLEVYYLGQTQVMLLEDLI